MLCGRRKCGEQNCAVAHRIGGYGNVGAIKGLERWYVEQRDSH